MQESTGAAHPSSIAAACHPTVTQLTRSCALLLLPANLGAWGLGLWNWGLGPWNLRA